MSRLASVLGRAFLALFVGATAASAAEGWRWEPARVPKALVIEGLWSDAFRWEAAMHEAGLRYQETYVSRSPYFRPYTQLFHYPPAEELRAYSVIVIANLDAPAITPARIAFIHEFVAQGGGLVVLGGDWAFSRGGYAGTPLEEMLPVTLPEEHRIPPALAGLPLSAGPQAAWKQPPGFAVKPVAFFVQTLVPKPGSAVHLLAGGKPALITGTFGRGRVVACALTATGDPPAGTLPFWDWPDWPRVLGQSLDWAAGARPIVAPAAAATKSPLTDDEMNSLILGTGVTPKLAGRIAEHPTPETAEALFNYALSAPAASKVDLASVSRTVLPFVKAGWGSQLRESLEKFSPDLKGRQAALILLGASHDPAGYEVLAEAAQKEPTKDAAIEALGRLGNPKAIPLIRELLARAERACGAQATEDEPAPGVFAHQQGSTIAASAIALFRLGEPEALPRLLEVYSRVRLYQRIFENAAKRRVAYTDPTGIGIRKSLAEGGQSLAALLETMRTEAGPIPETQRESFVKLAGQAKDPDAVEWLTLAMEQSPALPPAIWTPLTSAHDGIIARMAKTLAAVK